MKYLAVSILLLNAVLWCIGFYLTFNAMQGYDGPEPVATPYTAVVMFCITALIAHNLYVLGWAAFSKKKNDWTQEVSSVKEYYWGVLHQIRSHLLQGFLSLVALIFVLLFSFALGVFFVMGLVPFDFMQNRPVAYVWTSLLGVTTALSLYVTGLWFIRVLKKTDYANARFLYLVKMAPFLIVVVLSLIISGGDFRTILPGGPDENSVSTENSTGTCLLMYTSVIAPEQMLPSHGSIQARVDEIQIRFGSAVKPSTVNTSTVQLYRRGDGDLRVPVPTEGFLEKFHQKVTLTPREPLTAGDDPEVYTVEFKRTITGEVSDEKLGTDCHASFIVGDPESAASTELRQELLSELKEDSGGIQIL